MDLLDRYLAQVEKYLPRQEREEIINELRSLIMDHFDNDDRDIDDEDKLIEILKEFGAPISVAARYKKNKPIIYKEFEPIMVLIFKVLAITIPSALVFAKALDIYGANESVTMGFFLLEILKTVPNIFMSLVTSYGIVFLIFTGMTQGINPEQIKDEWDPKTLPKLEENIYKVSLFESLFGIAGGFVFLYIFNYQPGLVAIYYDGVREPLLNENFSSILPLLNLSVALNVVLYLIWAIRQAKDKLSVTFDAALVVFSGIILILLATSNIFNQELLDGLNLDILRVLFTIGMWVGAIGSFISAINKVVRIFITPEIKKVV